MSKLTAQDRAAFVSAYAKTLVSSWSDTNFIQLLLADPVAVLAVQGITLPTGIQVTVVPMPRSAVDPSGTDSGTDAQVELYARARDGEPFTLYLPDPPAVDLAELSSSELHGVAAGGIWDPYCCSCCPSCCSAAGYGR